MKRARSSAAFVPRLDRADFRGGFAAAAVCDLPGGGPEPTGLTGGGR
jgi:hypothetical protein